MSSNTDTLLTEDILHFLKQLYFGDYKSDAYKAASDRAFRDFCRTIRSKKYQALTDEEKEASRAHVTTYIKQRILQYHQNNPDWDRQERFDAWHKETSEGIISEFAIQKLTYGQAQKWLNMMCKYLLALGNQEVHGMLRWLHVPMDNLIIEIAVAKKMFTRPVKRWSQWSYDEYIKYQLATRKAIEKEQGIGFPPIVWEFRSWKNENAIS